MPDSDDEMIVGVLGGSFNPPHVGHVQVVGYAIDHLPGEEDSLPASRRLRIWIVPSGNHPFGKRVAAAEDRLEMCRRSFDRFGDQVVLRKDEIEWARERPGKPTYTVDTLRFYRQRFPHVRFRLLVGSDVAEEVQKWHRWDEIEELAPPFWIPRAGHPLPPDVRRTGKARVPVPNVSSTEIRRRRRAGESIAGLVVPGVEKYIIDRGLYLGRENRDNDADS